MKTRIDEGIQAAAWAAEGVKYYEFVMVVLGLLFILFLFYLCGQMSIFSDFIVASLAEGMRPRMAGSVVPEHYFFKINEWFLLGVLPPHLVNLRHAGIAHRRYIALWCDG